MASLTTLRNGTQPVAKRLIELTLQAPQSASCCVVDHPIRRHSSLGFSSGILVRQSPDDPCGCSRHWRSHDLLRVRLGRSGPVADYWCAPGLGCRRLTRGSQLTPEDPQAICCNAACDSDPGRAIPPHWRWRKRQPLNPRDAQILYQSRSCGPRWRELPNSDDSFCRAPSVDKHIRRGGR